MLATFGVADQVTISSLTIDDSSVPRRQTQQSSMVDPAIVNSPGTAARPAGAARAVVRLRPCRAVGLFLLLCGLAPAQAQPELQELKLVVGRSIVIDYPTEIARISTSNPEVLDAVAVSTSEVLLNAKSQGVSTIVIWPKSGRRSIYTVTVELNLDSMQKLLRETFPGMDIQMQAARDSVSLTGRVPSQAVADRATALVTPLAKGVVNNLQIVSSEPEKQIVLHVKFAELNRNAAKSFAVNLLSTGALNTPGAVTTGQFSLRQEPLEISGTIPARMEGTQTKFNIGEALNIFAFRPDLNLSAFIRALQTNQLLQILAEPNLVTTNGKEASFLVGGEFPIPVVQGGASVGAVTIIFKEFGIRLSFLPVITEHKTIRMHVRPEVSTIDLANAVIFSGFTVPALSSRRVETDIELAEGQSFVIGGLLDERVTESLFKIPGLASIPILGALFKSRQENKTRTELIIMVTPEITVPLKPTDVKPSPVMPKVFLGPDQPPESSAGRPPKGKKPKGRH
jgi:pilus assembly protein CpaC